MVVAPQTSIREIDKADLIIVAAIGLDIDTAISDHQPLPHGLESGRSAVLTSPVPVPHFWRKPGCWAADVPPRTGRWPMNSRGAIRVCAGIRKPSSPRTKGFYEAAACMA